MDRASPKTDLATLQAERRDRQDETLEAVKGDVQSVEISPDRKRAAIIVKEDAERRPRWNNLYIRSERRREVRSRSRRFIRVRLYAFSGEQLFVLLKRPIVSKPSTTFIQLVIREAKKMKPPGISISILETVSTAMSGACLESRSGLKMESYIR